jgi:hypothetical protein
MPFITTELMELNRRPEIPEKIPEFPEIEQKSPEIPEF